VAADPPALVCQVGSTTLRYHLKCLPPLLEQLRLIELEHHARSNRARALPF
jgi:hypothetical protein